jgi:hypothetical protein
MASSRSQLGNLFRIMSHFPNCAGEQGVPLASRGKSAPVLRPMVDVQDFDSIGRLH